MKVLVTGLCTLHWGRLEFGNIGNYYIIEPLFRELHRVFPEAEILTTFQMTEEFKKRERVTVLPMSLYYEWKETDLKEAEEEWKTAEELAADAACKKSTPYIDVVRQCEVVINVSGDMWGDNAEHVGHARFLVDLFKMRTAQLLGKKTILFAGTPGPFSDEETVGFAKEVYRGFDLVVNREPTSTTNMEKWGFVNAHVKDFACPAFLYTPRLNEEQKKTFCTTIQSICGDEKMKCTAEAKNVIGFTIGGFNMPVGPYDMWPRDDSQYEVFAEVIEHMICDQQAKVVLISHTNGFHLPPEFELINGRDYPILCQLREVVLKRGKVKCEEDLICLPGPYLPAVTKSLIGQFDMMVTGRVHASVAAVSQCIPTVFMTYEQSFIPSTKMYGFADLSGVGEFVCEPGQKEKMIQVIDRCYNQLPEIRERLKRTIPKVKEKAKLAFDEMKKIAEEKEEIHLLSTSLMVTEKCSLKCRLCLSYVPYYSQPEALSLEKAKTLLKKYFLLADTVDKFSITGGEPLTNTEIVPIVEEIYGYERQITGKVIFITNGTIGLPEELIQIWKKHPEKTKIIINDYGNGLSGKAEENYKRLCEAGMGEQTLLYTEENRYGWIDCRAHEQIHFTEEAIVKQAQSCVFHREKKFVIGRGELHTCTRSFYRMLKGIIPRVETEVIDLCKDGPELEEREKLREMIRAKCTTSCAFCTGLTDHVKKYPAAEQMK